MQGLASNNAQEIKPQTKEKCPRCESLNTKFCYYNNYSLSQPRYFCKSCRRYWTQGGTLRNVPIGGGSRKSKRPKTNPSFSSSSSTAPVARTLNAPTTTVSTVGGFGGYLPSLEAIQSSVDLGVYSFGLSEQSWAHRNFGGGGGGDDRNPTWTTINNNRVVDSSSAGNNKNSSVESEINCCNLLPNYHDHHHR